MYKSVNGGATFIATKILLCSASSTSWFSLIMEIHKERNMERSRDVDDAGRCLKQPSKRSYGAKKKRFAGKPKQNRWSFTQEGTPVSESKEERHIMWTSECKHFKRYGSFIVLLQNVLKITCIWGGRCYKKEGALLLTYILCPFERYVCSVSTN